jgi:MFS family permease
MGLDIPVSAFGQAWSDYRVFASINALLLIAFLLLGGVLGDALGRRRVMLFGVALATLANVLAVLTPAPPEFIAGRVLEAFGSALALPMTLGVIRLSFEGRARPLALLGGDRVPGSRRSDVLGITGCIRASASGPRRRRAAPTSGRSSGPSIHQPRAATSVRVGPGRFY